MLILAKWLISSLPQQFANLTVLSSHTRNNAALLISLLTDCLYFTLIYLQQFHIKDQGRVGADLTTRSPFTVG